jgi:hypothetical protein
VRRRSLGAIVLVTLASILPDPASAGTPRPLSWDLSLGALYSPTRYGGDKGGAIFWSGAITRLKSEFALRAEVMHGSYSDYPDAGPAEFTPVGVGVRYSPLMSGPFLQLVPLLVFARWGGSNSGMSRVLVGIDAGIGALSPHVGPVSLGLDVGYLGWDGGGEIPTFDAPSQRLDGVGMFRARVEAGLRF